jgi:hypothetical protein
MVRGVCQAFRLRTRPEETLRALKMRARADHGEEGSHATQRHTTEIPSDADIRHFHAPRGFLPQYLLRLESVSHYHVRGRLILDSRVVDVRMVYKQHLQSVRQNSSLRALPCRRGCGPRHYAFSPHILG